jgi:transcriptional regulator with XRE-family HTH domain
MDIPALIPEAMAILKVDQAALARRLGVGQPTVSRWLSGAAKPDYESCLRLAQITGLPAADVLRAAGRDPSLLPRGDPEAAAAERAERINIERVLGEVTRLLGPLLTRKRAQPVPA